MNWTELALTADEIISEFGQTIVLSHSTYGEYDPALGTATNTVTSTTVKGVLFDYGEKEVNGTTIISGDKRLLVTPIGVTTIVLGDSVRVNGKDYTVTIVTETNPAGTNLLYELSLRGVS